MGVIGEGVSPAREQVTSWQVCQEPKRLIYFHDLKALAGTVGLSIFKNKL